MSTMNNTENYTHTVVNALSDDAKEKLAWLYDGGAIAWEGMCDSAENLEAIYKAFVEIGAQPNDKLEFCSVKGAVMNMEYGLTGDNAYQDDLTVLACSLDGFDDWRALVFWRFNSGGRWFDDIVNNNAERERIKREAMA